MDNINAVLNEVINKMLEINASDMYISVNHPITFRQNDKLLKFSENILSVEDLDNITSSLLNEAQLKTFAHDLEFNFSIIWQNKKRFRLNFMHQQRHKAIVFRSISSEIPTIEQLGLPPIYADLALKKQGLILVSSPSGSGKSTSVAAMLNHRNQHMQGHIITIEDPIEFIHQPKLSIFSQREIGIDTLSYEIALKNAFRQKADVVFIGEIRDLDTMEHAINFAETGHLCFATLHSNNAHQAMLRIINLYPEELHKDACLTLATNLVGILSQKLVENLQNTRSLAVEILLNVGLMKNLIMDNRLDELKDTMEKNQDMGMITFDAALIKMVKNKIISQEVALSYAENAPQMTFHLNEDSSYLAINQAINKNKF
jgi:twitching motility protein PilU